MDEKEKEIGVKPIGKTRKLIGQIAIVLCPDCGTPLKLQKNGDYKCEKCKEFFSRGMIEK